ncbi:MAG: hypothetical protein JWP50_1581 [Phenylobacterium sp.]|nr:hypothetical protein [Phenylobacterium sp.]
MSDDFMSPFDDPNFDLNAWYTRSPDEIRKAKEARPTKPGATSRRWG